MNAEEYRAYLRSPHWRRKRQMAIQRAGNVCQECGKYGSAEEPVRLEVHHLTYVRLGRERLEDLRVLCVECHELAEGVHPDHLSQDGLEPMSQIAGRVLHFIGRRTERAWGRKKVG